MMQSTDRQAPASEQTLIQSLQRGLRLMEVVGQRGRVHAKGLANATGIALPTTYHLLRTLVHEGYLVRVDDGSYVLGDQLEQVAAQGRPARAVPKVRELLRRAVADLGASAYLGAYVDGQVILVEQVESQRSPRLGLWPGAAVPGHATALGKCILANLDTEARRRYLDRQPLASLTNRTVIDRRYLEDQLDSITDFAMERQEFRYGVACVAAPVRTPTMLGALGLAVPTERLARLRARRERVVELATELGDRLGAVEDGAEERFAAVGSLAG
jgi:DNA-binding IclR family transcriptional regulator